MIHGVEGWKCFQSNRESLAFYGSGSVGVCGQDKKYVFTLSHREYVEYASEEEAWQDEQMWVFESILQYNLSMTKLPDGRVQVKVPTSFEWVLTDLRPYDELTLAEEKNLVPMLWPQPVDVPEDLKLPSVAGRQYLAKATASVRMGDGTTVVGTKDGLLCLVRYGKVYNLGNAAPLGPVRCLTVSADGKLVWGTAGDDEDMGTMFTYDAVNGLVQRGTISYNVHGWMDGPTAAHVLTSIALSPDGKYLAVGNADRLGCVHVFKI
jgi:hypothetical protein